MSTCAEVFARTLREAGITRMFGLPGGEILDFIDAARREGIEFVLTRDESTASFMADVTGQIQRRPGVCVSTLGPGAINMTLGVANAYLDRSPLIAITASMAASIEPYATHQNLDLNAVYRPFTKSTVTLDGTNTAAKVRQAYRTSIAPRMGPVHVALPSDVARRIDLATADEDSQPLEPPPPPAPRPDDIQRVVAALRSAKRPILILGLDLNPRVDTPGVRRFVDHLGVPVFVTPKAKGILSEDHPLFFGVCAGVAADHVIVRLFERADLLVGVGFEPVESDKLWHYTMRLASIGPVSVAAGQYRPALEVIGEVSTTLGAIERAASGPFEWQAAELADFRREMAATLQPSSRPAGRLSPCELTERLRARFPRDTILTTDVGSIKSVTSQAWASFEPLSFFESNGLSAMGYGFAAAMAARLLFPTRPVLCTIGDGGFGMRLADVETCVRHDIPFVTVVYNDSSLSLIQVSQEKKRYPNYGVEYGPVDFAAACRALGAWSRRVDSLEGLDRALEEASSVRGPVVIEALVDPAEYRAHGGVVVEDVAAVQRE
ncbi:MAG: thiamine pyrophosphate-binding protein [Vicinamibacterales bacterium]